MEICEIAKELNISNQEVRGLLASGLAKARKNLRARPQQMSYIKWLLEQKRSLSTPTQTGLFREGDPTLSRNGIPLLLNRICDSGFCIETSLTVNECY